MYYSSTSVSAFPFSQWLTVQNVDLRSPVTQNAINNTNPTRFTPLCFLSHHNFRISDNSQQELSYISQDHKNHTENLFRIDTF